MVNNIRENKIPYVCRQCRVAFYHNLSPDPMNQTITYALLKKQDKCTAERVYGAHLSAVYIDHAYTGEVLPERPGFTKLLEDARAGKFDMIVTSTLKQFTASSDETLQVTEELLALPDPVVVRFEKDLLDSEFIHEILPLLREVKHE